MRKRKVPEEQPLADFWRPPADDQLQGGAGAAVSCISTTFEFDAGFFESELLPRFLGLRFDHTENERTFIIEREESLASTRVGLLVDAAKFDPRQTTLQWDQLPIHVPGGLQHSKLTLLVWERLVRLIVSSANLTRAGYRRNREVFAAIDFFDGKESAPLGMLQDALGFVNILCSWSRALPAATQRVRETVEQTRMRIRRWSEAPDGFRPQERPRAHLVCSHPRHPAGPARSALHQLIQVWQPRRVTGLTIVSPFIGQQTTGEDCVLDTLRGLTFARDAQGWLVVPEVPASENAKRRIVAVPRQFGQCWKKRFGENSYVVPVPLYIPDVDERPRCLHAKAILIEGDMHDLLMVGSSNFTPHGMGIGVYNCEANIAFEDMAEENRDGRTFTDRLGISWDDSCSVDDLVWQDPANGGEDAPPTQPYLPAFFAWASYSQATGTIRIAIDRNEPEPPSWTINLSGQAAEHAVILFARSVTAISDSTISFTLDEKARGVHLTALRVAWTDQDNVNHEGFLAVAVEDREADLLPPKEFCGLSMDGIIDCLLSGRTPAEWIERQEARRQRNTSTDAAIESLHAVDTSNYVLYRIRRFGRALAAMADRIARTPPIPDAIRYRLLRDPLGPVQLAEKMIGNSNGRAGEEASATETAYQLYSLAELLLSVGHVGRQMRRSCGRNHKWLDPLFAEARQRITTVIQRQREMGVSLPEDLVRYLDASFLESAGLLKLEEE